MARKDESRRASTSSSEEHARLLYQSLDQYNKENKRRRRPSIVLTALVVLFLSSAGGIALAIVLMVQMADIGAASLPRDVILFSGTMSLLYICLHIRGALRDYTRKGPGPPQLYGHYLHASALLVSRLNIACWIIALIATAVLISRALPFEGFLAKVPYLDLLLCIGAIPSCLIISVTIERNRTPFATAAISNPSLLTCRVSEYADDIATDMSVSRRSSLQRKKSETGSVLTLPTGEIFRLGDPNCYQEVFGAKKPDSLAGDTLGGVENPPMREREDELPLVNVVSPSIPPPTPRVSDPPSDPAVPEPVYYPGGWRTEWNGATQEAGASGTPEVPRGPASGSYQPSPSPVQHTPATTLSSAQASPAAAQPPPPSSSDPATSNTPKPRRFSLQRPATASTSIASSAARSNLSTVRYAAEPEIAVRQAIRVVPNPAYQPPEERQRSSSGSGGGGGEKPVPGRPDPVVLLRNAQRAQKTGSETVMGPRRIPSNFSRPMQRTGSQGEVGGEEGEGVERKARAAYVEDEQDVTT
ncbi:hypothetical protein F4859DRAFT_520623 [Xylaria cf. heliscus]|nr:hypothetical protein F4859DRAFT_520623 [Xylaria cf. heliscus]